MGLRLPSRLPKLLPVERFVGAEACQPCHKKIFEAWRSSPHGRAMQKPSAASVLGRFDGREVSLGDTKARALKREEKFAMEIEDALAPKREEVALLIASGRQHQVYLSRTADAQYRFLPMIWSVPWKRWISIGLYREGALSPEHALHWRKVDIQQQGSCFDCHLSQGHTVLTESGPKPGWIDLPVNCESCHGPGVDHVRLHAQGAEVEEPYTDLHALSKTEDLKLCGKCHGAKWNLVAPGARPNIPEHLYATLADRGLRPDGTQFSTTYQYAGHALSPCYLEGAMGCSSCHDPHAQHARDLTGAPAIEAQSDRQCTVCHRDRIESKAARSHSRHSAKVRCIDCHMSMSWITDESETDQRTSDHSISIPRPAEAIELGLPNACVTCHEERSPDEVTAWAQSALERWGQARPVRPWVRTIALARSGAPVALELLGLLEPERGQMLQASALELLGEQPADRALIPRLMPIWKGEAPQLRALALSAMAHHEPERAPGWLAQARGDASPFVRLLSVEISLERKDPLSEAVLREYLQTLLEHARNPPLRQLDRVIERYLSDAKLEEAGALIRVRLGMTTGQGPHRERWERVLETLGREGERP